MINQIIIILLLNLLGAENNRRESILLFNLDSSVPSLNIFNKDNFLIDFVPLNEFLLDHDAYKIERWTKFASDDDIYNEIAFSKVYRVYFKNKEFRSLLNIKNEFERLTYINIVEFDYYRKVYYTPNDPRYNNQWFLDQIRSNDAWDLWDISDGEIPGDRSIILASVDLGVNWQHPDLVQNLWENLGEDADGDGRTIEYHQGEWILDPDDLNGMDDDNWDNNLSTFIDDLVGWDVAGSSSYSENDPYGDNNPDVPNDGSWAHGTHVAGLLSATTNNNTGIASTAFNCSVMSVKCTAEEDDPEYIYEGYDGILYAAKAGYFSQGFSIINCSWGGTGYNIFEQELINMCANDYKALIFGAAGNDNIDQDHYPSSYDRVISVTALGQNNSWNYWATYHNTVDLASPGESIESCVNNNNGSGYSAWTGTSMASPVAASVAGLMKSIHPSWTNEQLETMIISTADPIIYEVNTGTNIEGKLGSGRVDALMAVTTPLFPKIELAGIDIFIQDDTNNEININETIELIAIVFNDPDWGEAINPELEIDCESDDIIIINEISELENIPPSEAGLNTSPFIIEFGMALAPGTYMCDLHFTSNIESYVQYANIMPIEFEVNDIAVVYGDLNQDEIVDVLDVIICIGIIMESIEPSPYQSLASDMNQDGDINIQDIVLMINLILD